MPAAPAATGPDAAPGAAPTGTEPAEALAAGSQTPGSLAAGSRAAGSLAAEVDRLRAEREALKVRCAEADARGDQLAAQLAEARAELARLQEEGGEGLSLFDDVQQEHVPGFAGDGSDPRVLPVILGGTAVVTAMVGLLAVLNRGLTSPVAVAMLVLTLVLAWFAVHTRVVPVEVTVIRGLVYIKHGEDTHRFDLRSDSTRVEMTGQPGDAHWQVRFLRRSLDPFTIDASMVDPHEFTARLREWRPAL